jgi:hypothetical protein
MALINSVLFWLIKKRYHQIELFIKYPQEVQSEWFKKLIQHGKETEWGNKYDYSDIKNIDEFKTQVPITNYDSLKPYIDRMRKGEQRLLWDTDVKWFAKSAGTTSDRSKYIPVTEESLEECHYKAGKDMLSLYFNNNPESSFFDGKGLALGGSQKIIEINNAEYYEGDLSAIIIHNLPYWAEFVRVPKRRIALLDNWETKIEIMAKSTIEHNVISLSGVPSWTLLLLKKILELTNKKNILDVWPNLEVFFHGGVNFDPYHEQFNTIIPSQEMIYINTYNASEGFFGIQDKNHADDMLLMLDYGVFYEFIPMENWNDENPKTINLEDVELNKNYALVISTNGGLWRYKIGDTIEFTSLSPYRIRITGRTKNFINAFGEELIIDNAETALKIACDQHKSSINEYTAAPIYFQGNNKAAHEWLIEFESEPKDLQRFIQSFDEGLKAVNSDYEAKRFHSLLLNEPIVRAVPKGTFYKWLKKKGKLGGQNKVPRLSNNRNYIDDVLKTIEN